MTADQPTPAETIRAAATRLREAAEKATPGPWAAVGLYRPLKGCRCLSCDEDAPWAYEVEQIDGPDNGRCYHPMHIGEADAAYLALVNPVVGKALADWLDVTARDVGTSSLAYHAALDVARALLAPSGEEDGR